MPQTNTNFASYTLTNDGRFYNGATNQYGTAQQYYDSLHGTGAFDAVKSQYPNYTDAQWGQLWLQGATAQSQQGDAADAGDFIQSGGLAKLILGGVAGGAALQGAGLLGGAASGAGGATDAAWGVNAAADAGTGGTFGGLATLEAASPGLYGEAAGTAAAANAGTGGSSLWDSVKNLFTSTPPGTSSLLQQAAGAAGGLPWGALASAASIGTGLLGLNRAGNLTDVASKAAASQDPFGQYRGEFANQLMALMADPRRIEELPGYKSGLRAQQRALAAQGFNPGKGGVPGQWSYAMDKFGGDQYAAEFARLGAGAGINIPPSGGNIMLTGALGSTALQGQALQSIIAGIRGLAS